MSASLDTTAWLELVSPSVTQFQSSLWVVASTLPTPRNSISALLGLLNLLLSTFAPVSYGDMGGIGSFISIGIFPSPQPLLTARSRAPRVFIPLFPLLYPNPLLSLHLLLFCFPSFLSQNSPVHSVAVLFCTGIWFPHIFLEFHIRHFSRSKILKYG